MRKALPLRLGVALNVMLALLGSCGGQDKDSCEHSCPAASFVLAIHAAGGGAVPGTQATLVGTTRQALACSGTYDSTRTLCHFFRVTSGSYSFEITAPGFQPLNVDVTVTLEQSQCGCRFVNPPVLEVTLNPSQS